MIYVLSLTIVGLATGCIYALTASGLVVTYTTSGVFNFAHGAIGMVMAFAYWELTVQDHWPQWLALIVVLGVFAPLLGIFIERVLIRSLHGATVSTTLVVTLGLLLALLGLAQTRWDNKTARILPQFFAGHQVNLFGKNGVNVTYHQLTMILVAVLVAGFLRLFLYRTRIGTAMRGVVDDPELAALNGADPGLVSATSWALGSMLAGVAGILLAPLVSLDAILLTLLVINGYAAAMVGRLKSLPLTFAGGIALGLAETFAIGKLPSKIATPVRPVLPIIFLFVVLLVLPQARLKVGRLAALRKAPRVASLNESLGGGALLIVGGGLISLLLSDADLALASKGVTYGMIMLSLVLLTGYAGQTSLCQLTFVGIGSYCMGTFFGGHSFLGIILAALAAGLVGALVALPALRLQGLYLALATLAFAQAASQLFFKEQLGDGGQLLVGRPRLPGVSFDGERAYFLLLLVTFAFAGIGVLALRRGRFGRMLVAMKDSPAACATLGINLSIAKLAVFAISSAIAGVAGVFYGGVKGSVGPDDFQMLNSLVLLLLVSVSGINTVTGALMGGLTFGFLPPKLTKLFPGLGNIAFLGTGFGALALGRNPYGWTSEFAPLGEKLRARFGSGRRPGGSGPGLASRAKAGAAPVPVPAGPTLIPGAVPGLVGAGSREEVTILARPER